MNDEKYADNAEHPTLAAAASQKEHLGFLRAPWAHHTLRLWATPEGGKDTRDAATRQAKEAASQALIIERANGIVDRAEMVLCEAEPDIFTDHKKFTKARTVLWNTVVNTFHLRWIIMTDLPENAARMIPEQWRSADRDRVGVAIRLDEMDTTFADRVAALRAIPACRRVLVIETPPSGIDYSSVVQGLDWVVVDGWNLDPGSFDALPQIRDACLAGDVRFFANWAGAKAIFDDKTWRQHPWGVDVDMDRPPVADVK